MTAMRQSKLSLMKEVKDTIWTRRQWPRQVLKGFYTLKSQTKKATSNCHYLSLNLCSWYWGGFYRLKQVKSKKGSEIVVQSWNSLLLKILAKIKRLCTSVAINRILNNLCKTNSKTINVSTSLKWSLRMFLPTTNFIRRSTNCKQG